MDISADAAAIIGQLLSAGLLERLVAKGAFTSVDLREIGADAGLLLETFQESFPARRRAFLDARRFFDDLAQSGTAGPSRGFGRKPPPTLRDRPQR